MVDVTEIAFGQNGTDRHHLGAGWSGDEPGYRWSVGSQSELWLDHPGGETDCVLEVTLAPYLHPPELTAQRLGVLARGVGLGVVSVDHVRTLAYRIPAAVLDGQGPVRITFLHPDAAAPAAHGHPDDQRVLGFSFRSLRLSHAPAAAAPRGIAGTGGVIAADIGGMVGQPAAQFMLRFESLGDNCEFGLVQRRCGAEPLGLLRFSNITLVQLLRALDAGFDGLGEPENMEFWLEDGNKPEYVLRDRSFGLVFHTFLHPGDVVEADLIAQQATRLKFLRRKLLEDLANGDKIFVIKRNDPLTQAEVLPVLTALRRHARQARLLFVVPASAEYPPGTVIETADGLLRGHIDRFAPPDRVPELSLEPWLEVCLNAARLVAPQPEAVQSA